MVDSFCDAKDAYWKKRQIIVFLQKTQMLIGIQVDQTISYYWELEALALGR